MLIETRHEPGCINWTENIVFYLESRCLRDSVASVTRHKTSRANRRETRYEWRGAPDKSAQCVVHDWKPKTTRQRNWKPKHLAMKQEVCLMNENSWILNQYEYTGSYEKGPKAIFPLQTKGFRNMQLSVKDEAQDGVETWHIHGESEAVWHSIKSTT